MVAIEGNGRERPRTKQMDCLKGRHVGTEPEMGRYPKWDTVRARIRPAIPHKVGTNTWREEREAGWGIMDR